MYIKDPRLVQMSLWNSPVFSLSFVLRDSQLPFEVRSTIKTPEGFVFTQLSFRLFKIDTFISLRSC